MYLEKTKLHRAGNDYFSSQLPGRQLTVKPFWKEAALGF